MAKIKELEDRGPIDVQALISGKIEKRAPRASPTFLEVKEDMMLYNAKKYDPDNKLYTDDAYAQKLGYGKDCHAHLCRPRRQLSLTAFNGKARDFLAVTGLKPLRHPASPVYAGDTLYLVKDKLELIGPDTQGGQRLSEPGAPTYGSVYNQNGVKVLEVMFSARENLKIYEDPADMGEPARLGNPSTGGPGLSTTTPTPNGRKSSIHGRRKIPAVTRPSMGGCQRGRHAQCHHRRPHPCLLHPHPSPTAWPWAAAAP